MTAKTKVSSSAEETVEQFRRETRRKWNVEEKSRIVLEELRGEVSMALTICSIRFLMTLCGILAKSIS